MFESQYISKGVRSVYYDIKANSINQLIKPHLCIYLDVPVETVKQRIKERNIDYEVNSKALTDKYLQSIDTVYKQRFLKEVNVASELLVYDWSNGGEAEVVVEDIERIGLLKRFDLFIEYPVSIAAFHFRFRSFRETWSETEGMAFAKRMGLVWTAYGLCKWKARFDEFVQCTTYRRTRIDAIGWWFENLARCVV